jgi:DNA-binding NtrC family response regulator
MPPEKATVKPNLLLIDDEEMYLEYLSRRLIKRGYEVTKCLSGEEALEKVGRSAFDVVVLDVLLPGIDGIETLREIKRMAPLAEVIMLTGHASLESGIEGMKLGAFDYLRKPCDTADLVSAINHAYEKKLGQEQRIQETMERYNIPGNRTSSP